MLSPSATICFLGFSELGNIFGADLASRGCAVRSYVQLDSQDSQAHILRQMQAAGVDAAPTLAAAVRGAKLVISTVGSMTAATIARAAAALLQPGQVFLELNVLSPAIRRDNAAVISASGALYMEGVIAEPPQLYRLATPLQLTGTRAVELVLALNSLGFNARAAGLEIGVLPEMTYYSSTAIRGTTPDEALAGIPAWRGELP